MASWKAYDAAFRSYGNRGLITPTVPAHCGHNGHLYYLILPTPEQQRELIDRLRVDGITAPFHYVPLHSSPAGQAFGRVGGELPVTEALSSRLLRLPLFPRMGEAREHVIERVQTHLEGLI